MERLSVAVQPPCGKLCDMNPFDMPPSSPPVWSAPQPPAPKPRRGRVVIAVVAAVGVVGATAFGLSQLVSADDEPDASAAPSTTVVPATTTAPDDESDSGTDVEGELRLDVDDGEEIIVDLEEFDEQEVEQLHECLGLPSVPGFPFGDEQLPPHLDELFENFDSEQFQQQLEDMWGQLDSGDLPFDSEELQQQFEDMMEDFDPEQFRHQFEDMMEDMLEGFDPGAFRRELDGASRRLGAGERPGLRVHGQHRGPLGSLFGSGGQVTVVGPDGVTVIDLGDGDGTVTITRDGETGEITVETDGTASETDLDEMFGAFPRVGDLDRQQVETCLAELD